MGRNILYLEKMKKEKSVNCYRCDSSAIDVEHIPARSFFPKGKRIDLITVPSCSKHNTEKSKEDEYVRNLFSMNAQINDIGIEHGLDKTYRSLLRNSKLLSRMFARQIPLVYDGEKILGIKYEKERVIEYISGVCYGLHRKDFNSNYQGYWYLIIDFQNILPDEDSIFSDKQRKLIKKLSQCKFPNSKTKNPEIFQYSYMIDKENIPIYKIIFYEKILIYATYKDYISSLLKNTIENK